jgi:hypothetical protein
MTYEELLNKPAWKEKRLSILQRDNNKCQHCHNASIIEQSKRGKIVDLKRRKLLNQNHNNHYQITLRLDNEQSINFDLYSNSLLSHDLLKRYEVYYEDISKKDSVEYKMNLFIERVDGVIENHYARELHVHHQYYQEELLPWEYPDGSLTTLCWICHKKLHASQKIKWFDKDGLEKGTITCCWRCGGSGYFPEYKHVELGICFRCRGAKYEELINIQS